ncbi:copper chaperone PCu(A)C [Nonomuraea soli]|uniref:Copper chaperone PCu(A)C n=1 Tax=Nonomuraea soli TaxID=1032476 RepID=A0A7W0CGC5_9ACTN|nr:copper chaperone PCu(A)C [Nonomuraea soli]MBA2890643.1 hypothetical protein [Nonomuraea soli]
MQFRHALIAAAAALSLAACGTASAPAAAPGASSSPRPSGPALSITDPWVKTAAKGMSAAFGTLTNTSGQDITVLSASTPVSPMVELHETVEDGGKSVMRAKDGGFVVPAGGTLELKPGGNHIMLMGLKEPVLPGAEVSFSLALAGGGTMEFTAVGKDFAGANETYQPGHGG